jgi:hypothetical protein
MTKAIPIYKNELWACRPGLPDGLFSNQRSQSGKILEVLAMEESGIFYGHLVNFPAIWYS